MRILLQFPSRRLTFFVLYKECHHSLPSFSSSGTYCKGHHPWCQDGSRVSNQLNEFDIQPRGPLLENEVRLIVGPSLFWSPCAVFLSRPRKPRSDWAARIVSSCSGTLSKTYFTKPESRLAPHTRPCWTLWRNRAGVTWSCGGGLMKGLQYWEVTQE